jgi:gamma-glutamyltranspeptidase/glutathione hydrolase
MLRDWRWTRPDAPAEQGMVVTKSPFAAEAGLEMLRAGGNAVDAAVAASFSLAVVEPFSAGMAGGGHMLVHQAASGETSVVDFAMRAPGGATPDMYELEPGSPAKFGWTAVRDEANVFGALSVTVPGTPAGLCEAHRRWGILPLDQVLGPAIRHAEQGVPLDLFGAATIAYYSGQIAASERARAMYFRDGRPLRPLILQEEPEILVQEDLGRVLRAIGQDGPAALYDGPVAEAIGAEVRALGGVLSADDLRGYRPGVTSPGLRGSYRDVEIVAVPDGCGGTTVVEALQILDGLDLAAHAHNSVASLHRIAEALHLAFADRYERMGDPDFVGPFDFLGTAEHAAARRSSLSDSATVKAVSGPIPVRSPTETVQVSVVDSQRNVVSLTTTLLGWSGVIAPETGFSLNGAMRWFDPRPGRHNSVAGGKRPLTNMSPLILRRNGVPFLALGGVGARRIISALVQVVVNMVDYGMPFQEAIEAPRIDASGEELLVDTRLGGETLRGLERLGHRSRAAEEAFLAFIFASPSGIHIEGDRLRGGASFWEDTAVLGY